MDDQLARANAAASAGGMIVLDDPEPVALQESIEKILDPAYRDAMKQVMAELATSNGATESAEYFMELLRAQ